MERGRRREDLEGVGGGSVKDVGRVEGASDIGIEGGCEAAAEGEGCGRGLHIAEGDVEEMEGGLLEHSRHGCHSADVRWLVHR